MSGFKFETVNLDADFQTCILFREDSFVVSFGSADKFYEADGLGAERYIEFLRNKIKKDKDSVVHVWAGNEIIGQIEMGTLRGDPSCGYVNLFYLRPDMRGKGFGIQLDNHAMSYFKKLGCNTAKLSVSPSNIQALNFYKKMGWQDLGARPDHPEVHFMRKSLDTFSSSQEG